MITYFSMSGFLSIKDPIELFFMPRPGARIKNTRFAPNFIETKKYRLAKSLLLFGLNASGKSNILLGLTHLIEMIRNGLNLSAMDDSRRNLINFDSQSVSFTIGLYDPVQNSEYFYSLRYNCESIQEEELKLNDRDIYSFSENKLSINDSVKAPDRKSLIRLMSRPSTELLLFKLNDYLNSDIAPFRRITGEILYNLKDVVPALTRDAARLVQQRQKPFWDENHTAIFSILHMTDPTITDFRLEPFRSGLYQLILLRGNKKFSVGIESQGIQKICHLIDQLVSIMIHGGVFLLDELDSSISTQCLLSLFNNLIHTDFNKGQFLMTSHNPLLMNQNLFHPQQLYIVNKKEDLTTEVYPLDDFDLRADKTNLYEDYLKGRFGGSHV